MTDSRNLKSKIAKEVRALRKQRALTQAELATKLGLSQSRLSEIEGGGGSFTAEQLLWLLGIFNVTPARFTGQQGDPAQSLQNALVRLGAYHLVASDAIVPATLADDVGIIIRDTLLSGDPRLTASLAPVLVVQLEGLILGKIYLDLARVGAERRLAWVLENTRIAIAAELDGRPPRAWAQHARRADAVFESFLGSIRHNEAEAARLPPDILDPTIRSGRSLDEVATAASAVSRKWNIVTSLVPADFQHALRGARVGHP